MKTLTLIISLMMAAIIGMGQKHTFDTTKNTYIGGSWEGKITTGTYGVPIGNAALGDTTGRNGIAIGRPALPPKTDTIPIIILYCDTIGVWKDEIALWGYGYSVRKSSTYMKVSDNGLMYYPHEVFIHDHYLNDKKKPFPKNIIIWQSKSIQNDK